MNQWEPSLRDTQRLEKWKVYKRVNKSRVHLRSKARPFVQRVVKNAWDLNYNLTTPFTTLAIQAQPLSSVYPISSPFKKKIEDLTNADTAVYSSLPPNVSIKEPEFGIFYSKDQRMVKNTLNVLVNFTSSQLVIYIN